MPPKHIAVCICTYKRPDLLSKLLAGLEHQITEDLFTYSVVVADNDERRSAEPVVAAISAASPLTVTYCTQPDKNIALTRNAALHHADAADLIAFIDDDELPVNEWLLQLFKAYSKSAVAGVLGPVRPRFLHEPPRWITKGSFFDRPVHPTGYRLTWMEARTGNVLFSKDILEDGGQPFDPKFHSAGEDMDFFRRMMNRGKVFIWCEEAPVYEVVPPYRCSRMYLLKRALLRGSNFSKHPADRVKNVAKSLIAVSCYTVLLPVLLLL